MSNTTALRPSSGGSTDVAKLPLRQVSSVKVLLMNDQAKQQIASVAAGHMKPERLMRLIANAARTTPKLYDCEPMSLLGALMQCASLNLEPNTVLGHAYLIPFDNNRKVKDPETGREQWVKTTEVQLIVGYKGLIDLARRSGHITSLSANIHYSDDEMWEYEEGTEATLRHRPGPQQGDKLHAYAIAKFKDGGHAYVVLPWAKVMSIRDGSQGWQSAVKFGKQRNSPWFKHEDEMAKKTAIRALAKYLPLSIEFMDAVQVDSARADFARFAQQPLEGLTIEQNSDEDGVPYPEESVDPETGEVTYLEDQRAGQQTIEQPREREPVQRRQQQDEPAPRRQTRSRVEEKDEAPADDEPGLPLEGAAPAEDVSELVNRVREWAVGDMIDGAEIEATLAAYGDQLAIIEKADPKAHAALVAEIRKAQLPAKG